MTEKPILHRDIEALLAFIEQRQHIPHDWSNEQDCVSFARGAVAAQTGIDHLAGVAPWTNIREARKVIQSLGGLEAAVDARLNRVAPAFARRGDIAAVPDEHFGIRLMIIEGATLVAPGDGGLVRLPRSAMTIAWDAASLAQSGNPDE